MKKIIYTLCMVILSGMTFVNAQSLTGLGVRFSQDTSKKLNSVPGFNAAVTDYTVYLSSTQTVVPKVEATPASGSSVGSNYVQATSITGTEAERTATVTVTETVTSNTRQYKIVFVKSENYIEGFTEDAGYGGFFVDGDYNHGEELGNRSCRTSNNAIAAYWTLPVFTNGAGKLTFYITKDSGTANLLSTFKVKKQTASWSTLLTYDAASYEFPAVGVWKKVELDIDESGSVSIQFELTKTGITRDFRIDDVVVTPFNSGSSFSLPEVGGNTIFASAGRIYIEEAASAASQFAVYDMTGRLIKEGKYDGQIFISMEKGNYVVKVGTKTQKVTVP